MASNISVLVKWLPASALLLLAACSSGLQQNVIPSEPGLSAQAEPLVWKRIAISSDDAEETLSTGAVTLDSIDLDFGSNSSGNIAVGVRFTGIDIPQGAQIESAYLYFLPSAASSTATTMQIYAQNADDAATFTSAAHNITSRTRSTGISWTVPAWDTTMDLQSPAVRSPDLAGVVQTVVDHTDWQSSNALAFILEGTGQRIAHSFDGTAGNKPALEITYTIPPPQTDELVWKRVAASSDDAEETLSTGNTVLDSIDLDLGGNASGRTAVGVRFTGTSIPQGAQIKTAYLSFLPSAAGSSAAIMQIYAQAADNAGNFGSSVSNNITRRDLTTGVTWTVPAWNTTMDLQSPEVRSPNLASIVQAVVDRSGWQGDAISFVIEGSGERVAYSFEGASGNKPALEITYVSTETPPPPPPTQATSCLSTTANRLTPQGTYNTTYPVEGQPANTDVQAEAAKFLAKQTDGKTPFIIGKNASTGDICVHGGYYDSGLPDTAFWDCGDIELNNDPKITTPEETRARNDCEARGNFHGKGAQGIKAGYYPPDETAFQTPNITIEGIAVGTTGDGVAFKAGTDHWTFRDSYVRHAGDDGVESDFFNNGLIDNVLVDWAYSGISCRHGSKSSQRPVTLTVQNSLLALKRQEGTASQRNPDVFYGNPNHNELFKWNRSNGDYTATTGCKLVLKNNVFLLTTNAADYIYPEDDPKVNWDAFNESACQNNTVIYLDSTHGTISYNGSNISYKQYLQSLENRFPNCFTVKFDTIGLDLWKSKRGDWFDKNPEFSAYKNSEPAGAN